MTHDERAQIIEKIIRLAWESLESHLEWTHTRSAEGKEFHQQCVHDYARLIELVSQLYTKKVV